MLDHQLTFRLTPADAAALLRIATVLRETGQRPFVTRTDAVKAALHAVAADPARFLGGTPEAAGK